MGVDLSGRLAGHCVLVTGAGSGLGRATALRLAAEGARVLLTDADEAGLAATAASARAAPAPAEEGDPGTLAGDLLDPGVPARLIRAAEARFGRLDGLCNVAGISPAISFEQTTPADFDAIMGVNCKAQMFLIQAALPLLRSSAAASIVNVSSVGGRVALPHLVAYGASKAAVIGLTRGVAQEFAAEGIRCNAVCPGGIDTPMAGQVVGSFPDREAAIARLTGRQLLKRFAAPEEISSLIAYLISTEASFITGAVIDADAGHTSS
jgi:NAD(P)-dependent dehydrogenase (short-subunit alcohol dehydrogenase family)